MSPIDALPTYKDRAHFLYALEFADGVVKIGRSFKPRSRALQLQAKYGQAIVRCTAARHNDSTLHLAERDALRAAAKIGKPIHGAEFFQGLPFDAAAALICDAAASKPERSHGPAFSQTKAGRKAAAMAKQEREAAHAAVVFGWLVDALASKPAAEAA